MEDLEPDACDPREEEQADDVRVDQRVQESREEAGLDVVDLRAREVQDVGALDVLRLVAVELLEQRGQARRDDVDHVQLQRPSRGEVRRLADREARPMRVPVMCRGERRQRRRRVVDHLAPEIRAEVPAARVDRGRRADVGGRRHGQHVRGLGDPHPGRGGARAVGGDVDDHRQLRVQLRRVDRLHRGREAAGRVEQDHRGGVAVVRRAGDLVGHVVLGDGVDLEVGPEPDREDARLRRARAGGGCEHERQSKRGE